MRYSCRFTAGFLTTLILAVGAACNEDQLYDNAVLETSFKVASTSVMNNLVLENANLRVASVDVTGIRNATEPISIVYNVTADESIFQLVGDDPHQPVRLSVNRGQYDSMRVVLKLAQDNYQLVISESADPTPVSDDGATDDNGNEDPAPDNGGPPDDNSGETPVQPQPDDEDDDASEDEDSDDDSSDDDSDEDGEDDEPDSDGNNDGDEDDDDSDSDEDTDDDEETDDDSGKGNGDNKNKGDKGKDNKDKEKGDKDNDKGKDKGEGKEKDKDKSKGDDKKGKKGGRNAGEKLTTIDLAGFFANAKPSIYASLLYTNGSKQFRVLVSVDDFSQFTFKAPGASYTLGNMYGNTATGLLNVNHWFDNISTAELEAGVITNFQGQNILLIHRQINSKLYERIKSKLQTSASLEVNVNTSDL